MSKWTDQLPEAARDYIGNRRVDEVECIIGDIAGVARGKAMPAAKFAKQTNYFLPNSISLQTITGEWADKPISLYGRNSASGTYGFFKDVALFGGDYKDEVKEQPGSSSVVQGIASDKFAIGYSGIGYKTADVRAVPIAAKDGDEAFAAEPENGYSGDYPLSRFLFVYVNYKPGSDLDPLRREFIRYVFSQEGQAEVVKCGYLPIRSVIATKALKSVGIE